MIDFIGKKKIYFTVSLALVALAILFAVIFGVQIDIQFKGGTIITYSYQGEIDKGAFQSEVETILGGKTSIKESKDVVTGANNIIISLAESKGIPSEKLLEVSTILQEKYKDNDIQTVSTNSVDPIMGKEFFAKSLVAVAFASILMIVYVALRFKRISGWSAGSMAVIALLHDVMVIFATFIVFRIPLNDNFIAVVLTILGYSLNDTIVIYDRIRENKKIYGEKLPVAELVNKSINQSLSRSIATTLTTVTALVVVSVVALIFNVNSILSFSFPLIIGMLSGVYSSICIAGPLWVMWQERKKAKA